MLSPQMSESGPQSGSDSTSDYYLESAEKPSYMVRIGQEIALEGLEDCSL